MDHKITGSDEYKYDIQCHVVTDKLSLFIFHNNKVITQTGIINMINIFMKNLIIINDV